jgi:hypothetical protein
MDDALVVRCGHPGADLPRDLDRLLAGEPSDPADERREVFAVDVLHRQEVGTVRLADVVDAADVRVGRLTGEANLRSKAIQSHRIGGEVAREDTRSRRLPV